MRSFMRLRKSVNCLTRSSLVSLIANSGAGGNPPMGFKGNRPRPRKVGLQVRRAWALRASQQRFELTLPMQRDHVVVSADMGIADEDLRHAGAPGARHHLLALGR